MRFIDLASHGGCSKKGPATQVRNLLQRVQREYSDTHLELVSQNFPDCGSYQNGELLLSTIDIVLPMTLSPIDFGKITVCHTLSDLYASGGLPMFALCVLGVPGGMAADADVVVEVMGAASGQLNSEGAVLVGGHTMTEQEDFYLGFSAVGRPIGSAAFAQASASDGDAIILTKPLGTSIATARWKLGHADEIEHADVIEGMKRSNRLAAMSLSKFGVHACTDVTGYGLVGHLFNILTASGTSAEIEASSICPYPSVRGVHSPEVSSQFWYNKDYTARYFKSVSPTSPLLDALLFDSQVSGGLLACVAGDEAEDVIAALKSSGDEAFKIGTVRAGLAGQIDLAI